MATRRYARDQRGSCTATPVAPPAMRRLRGYAFDPSLGTRLDTALVNRHVFEVAWECDLAPGPVGEYLEVVDFDPTCDCWFDPVDLNAAEVLAQDGLPPSEGTPQFHQQMAYAVAMTTIQNFEFALGRRIFWAPHYEADAAQRSAERHVRRLRIYPHALRAPNAYYSPEKKAILFGYFRGPLGMVFTCLSHDIIAHETTHALLDGMHRRYIEDNHPDTLAFHEAFADLVALLQHFTFPEVLRHQIARTRGDLASQSLLGELAQQFGQATGRYGALRDAIGEFDDNGQWRPLKPDPARLAGSDEPHARGAVLVAAVFGAFLAIYKTRGADLLRLASAGSGILPAGAIHPDLVDRLATEAGKAASHFLTMCIRALDYCPPVDVTFGDYLRALVTADFDMVSDDSHGYRVALIESFRQWGIVPADVRTLSEEHLRWTFAADADEASWDAFNFVARELRPLISESLYFDDREQAFHEFQRAQARVHELLEAALSGKDDALRRAQFECVTGLRLDAGAAALGVACDEDGKPRFEVHAVRPALRVSPEGWIMKQMLVTVTQHRRVPLEPDDAAAGTFEFRGGSTLIFDLEGPSLRYAITRRIDDDERLERVRSHRRARMANRLSLADTYFAAAETASAEPFALLHCG